MGDAGVGRRIEGNGKRPKVIAGGALGTDG